MPEGHTIHRLSRDHNQEFAGQKLILSSPQGRFEQEANLLTGKRLNRVEAHGKHLFYFFGGKTKRSQKTVHIHLGLYGKFRRHNNPPPEPRGAVRVRVIGKEKAFDLNGPNRCELLEDDDLVKLQSRLGQDPLRQDAEPELAWERIHKSRAAIGSLLLNQKIIAGIGNVYRADLLFLLKLHPEKPGNQLTRQQFDGLWDLTVQLMNIGVKYNRIITADRLRIDKPPSRLNARERLVCYKKTRCVDCGKRIRKWELGARTMYACEHCQV